MKKNIVVSLAFVSVFTLVSVFFGVLRAEGKTAEKAESPYASWNIKPWNDKNYFPLAVWLQSPNNIAKYKEAGINLYVGVFGGPKQEKDLEPYEKAGMMVICSQTEGALSYAKQNPNGVIAAWMHGDEPDNAQAFAKFWGGNLDKMKAAWPGLFDKYGPKKPYNQYGAPIPPSWIIRDYKVLQTRDPRRPIMLNLGVGVADKGNFCRGERTGKQEDYPEYLKGCDIGSFDIYPVVAKEPVKGNLWYVPKGVENLRKWSEYKKPVWNCIECTHIGDPNALATPEQIKSEVWMSIIAGSTGIIYFCHEFKPKFIEAGLLAHSAQLSAVTAINRQITELAPVLNSPTIKEGVEIKSSNNIPVSALVKTIDGVTYVFAAAMQEKETAADFKLKDGINVSAEVIGEGRTVMVSKGEFKDNFKGYEVHIYRIKQ